MRTRLILLLALAMGAGTLSVSAQASPSGRRAAAFQRWEAGRQRMLHHLPIDPALRQSAESLTDDDARLVPAGDLDGDGLKDLLDLRQHLVYNPTTDTISGTAMIDAHRGIDGAQLWTASLGATQYVFAWPSKVGTSGGNGVLVVQYNDTYAEGLVAGVDAGTMTLSAYDGHGTQTWTRTFSATGSGSLVTYSDAFPYLAGTFDAVAGGGTDALVVVPGGSQVGVPFVAAAGGASAQLLVVDGANGTPKPLGVPLAGNGAYVEATPVADLDADHLDDAVLTTTTANSGRALAVSGGTGKPIWTATLPDADDSWPDSFGDVTGDGIADVVVDHSRYGGLPIGDVIGGRVSLLDGKTGTVRWTKPGDLAFEIGHGLVGTAASVDEDDTIGIAVAAYDVTGAERWSVRRSVKWPDSSAFAETNVGRAGDVEPDGYGDLGYLVSMAATHGGGSYDGGTVSGRTGRVIKDPVRDLYLAHTAIDGRGDDAFTRAIAKGLLTVVAWRGDGSRMLWRTALPVTGSSSYYLGQPVDRDHCGDLMVSVRSDATSTTYALSGATGLPLWSLSRTGTAAAVIGHPHVAKNSRMTKASC